ncbi:MAG: DNA ligase D [Terracidiphilus sp.]|jgi:bifunctional non-homologous end joining protein LigD
MAPRDKKLSDPAAAVDRQLARYRAMRDFKVTAEPRGGATRHPLNPSERLPFVIQKHAARQLHYDFRLGWEGVLKSWAVAKGPSYFPGDKRLAVEVEDHPMEYGGFEGTIPKGQYGGGTVMVWDFGDWQPLGDPDRQLEKGDLKFILNGTKLKGKWVLVRMRHRDTDRSDRPNWLLIKERDEYTQPEGAPAITDLAPDSALTQRTMEQITQSNDHVWDSKQGLLVPKSDREPRSETRTGRTRARKHSAVGRMLGAVLKEDFPGFIPPQLAEEARSAQNGQNWVHELKLDGYRIQVHVQTKPQGRGTVAKTRLLTRKGLDWTARMPTLAQAAAGLGVESAILDGEIVVLDDSGRSTFSDLQAAFQNGKNADMIYFAFDLLNLNGHNLRGLPLIRRKEILENLLLQAGPSPVLKFCEHIKGRGEVVFRKASELGAEGIVSKQVGAPYTSGRGNTWLKMKSKIKQEFVIAGFSPLAKTGRGVGSLLLGYYDCGKLLYAGRCGTGFSNELERTLRIRLDALVQQATSFTETPREARQGAIWVKPELVAQVAFAGWTKDDLIRQSSFKGLRDDKPPTEVVREFALMEDVSLPQAGPRAQSEVSLAKAKGDHKQNVALSITHPRKVLDEESGMTKQQLAEYYLAVAERMLPHVSDRPLSVLRCPDGIGKQSFFQKHVSGRLPNGVHTVSILNRKTGKHEDFLTLNSAEGLVGMAQMGVLEIHPWGSKNGAVDQPDRVIFDLDPDEAIAWHTLADAAKELRSRLKQLKLTSYVKNTGGKGLHVVVPIEPEFDWAVIKQFSHRLMLDMEKGSARLYTTNMSKAVRKNRIYLDYLRNDREATAIAPFSTRARPGVPVAVTLDWKELEAVVRPAYHVSDLDGWRQRLRRDPWRGLLESRQKLTQEMLASMGVKFRD